MINISGTFSYQPPSRKGVDIFPATFSIALAILSEDGVPVLDQRNELNRLSATVIIGYPQGAWGDAYVLKLKSYVFGPPPANFVHVSGEFDLSRTTTPPAGWMPAAILIQLDNTWTAIITAAAPAVPNSGIALPEHEVPFPVAEGQAGMTATQAWGSVTLSALVRQWLSGGGLAQRRRMKAAGGPRRGHDASGAGKRH